MPGKSKDKTSKGITRRDFIQTAGMATLAMGSGVLSLTSGTALACRNGHSYL